MKPIRKFGVVALVLLCGMLAGDRLVVGQSSIQPVRVTFRDAPTPEKQTADRLLSDRLGPYQDGKDFVDAGMTRDGRFLIDVSKNDKGPRWLEIDLTAPVPPTTAQLGVVRDSFANLFVKIDGDFFALPIGATLEGGNVSFQFAAGGTGYFLRFWPSKYPGTTNVLVRRTSATTWEVEAEDSDVARLLSYPLRGKFVLTEKGNYSAPFKIVIEAI